jgi:hypothetical protein
MDGTPRIADVVGALHPHGAFKVTYFYTALCIYVATLAAFLGWWARLPR